MARTFQTTAERTGHIAAVKAARLVARTAASRVIALNQARGLIGVQSGYHVPYVLPAIASASAIAHGASGGTIVVTLVGDTFKAGIATSNITFGYSTTALTISTTTRNNSGQITLVFTGTADGGNLTITPKAAAYDVGLYVPATLTIVVPAS